MFGLPNGMESPPVNILGMKFGNNGLPTDSNFDDSATMKRNLFMHYLNYLIEIAITRFEWKNLPDTVDDRYLELVLLCQGKCLFFKDDVVGYLVAACTATGINSFYNVPPLRMAYASNGYHEEYTDKDSVIIWNNYLRMEGISPLRIYAQRLANIEMTMDVNIQAQKTPILLIAPETQRLTLKNVYMQYSGDQPVIFGQKNFDPTESIQSISTGAPFIAPELIQLRNQILNDALGYLGVITQTGWKQERQTAQEVVQNNSNTVARRFSPLLMRQQAADQINKMFGLNIEVEFREDTTKLEKLQQELMLAQQGMNRNQQMDGDDDE